MNKRKQQKNDDDMDVDGEEEDVDEEYDVTGTHFGEDVWAFDVEACMDAKIGPDGCCINNI